MAPCLWAAVIAGLACDDGGGARPDAAVQDSGTRPEPRDSGVTRPPPERDAAADLDAGADEDAGSGATGCGAGECDLLDPGSCSEGQGCVLLVDDESMQALAQCTDVGQGRDGDACDSHLECGPGLDCTGAGGQCRRPCCALNQVAGCPAGQFCRVALTDAEGMPTGVGLCDRCDECDLSDPESCGEGLGCYALGGASRCAACLPAGAAETGERCGHANDCAAGAGCFATAGGELRCVAFCNRESEDACPEGTSCRQVAGVELPEAIGLCL